MRRTYIYLSIDVLKIFQSDKTGKQSPPPIFGFSPKTNSRQRASFGHGTISDSAVPCRNCCLTLSLLSHVEIQEGGGVLLSHSHSEAGSNIGRPTISHTLFPRHLLPLPLPLGKISCVQLKADGRKNQPHASPIYVSRIYSRNHMDVALTPSETIGRKIKKSVVWSQCKSYAW